MNPVPVLLKPRWVSLKQPFRRRTPGGRGRWLSLAAVGAVFWCGLFYLALRVLSHFRAVEEIGDLINAKLLSMLLITILALLIFSSILTAISRLYLSRDLTLVHSMPVSGSRIFAARWIDAGFESSWMVLTFALPVLIALGAVYHAGPLYFALLAANLLALAVAASVLAAGVVMAAVLIIPAGRMKNAFLFLSILLFVGLYMAIRLLKPEVLVDPETFDSVLVYISALQAPLAPWMPTTWVYDALQAALAGSIRASLFHTALIWSFAGLCATGVIAASEHLYYPGFSRSQTASTRKHRSGAAADRTPAILSGPWGAYLRKEIKCFFRDQTQWSQLFLIAALVFIYLYNFKVLPLDRSPIRTEYLQNLLAFLNTGLALFVLTAISGRFAYPAVSTEREAFWLVKTAPGSLRTFLWIKFLIYLFPLLILTEMLIVATNLLLQVTPFMMWLSTATVGCLVPGIVAMAIGLGAAYPNFKAENPAQAVTSFGGVMFMMLSAVVIALVIAIQAGPVYRLFMADFWSREITRLEWLWILASSMMVLGISVGTVWVPMRFGEARLARHPL